jgi:hypothetical protein
MIKTRTARDIRYATPKKVYIHLFLMPTKPYTSPVIISIAPAKPTAGVSFGEIGRGTGSPVVVWLEA